MPFGSVASQTLPRGKVVPLVLNQILILGEHPELDVMHLGESNAAFWSDALARAGSTQHAGRSSAVALTPEEVHKNRLENRDIVARHAVHGHRGFFHDYPTQPGVADPENPAKPGDLRDIVFALPDDVFDSVLNFVRNEQNFRDRPTMADPKVLAGK